MYVMTLRALILSIRLMLVTRDEQSYLVVSYKEIKACVNPATRELGAFQKELVLRNLLLKENLLHLDNPCSSWRGRLNTYTSSETKPMLGEIPFRHSRTSV